MLQYCPQRRHECSCGQKPLRQPIYTCICTQCIRFVTNRCISDDVLMEHLSIITWWTTLYTTDQLPLLGCAAASLDIIPKLFHHFRQFVGDYIFQGLFHFSCQNVVTLDTVAFKGLFHFQHIRFIICRAACLPYQGSILSFTTCFRAERSTFSPK